MSFAKKISFLLVYFVLPLPFIGLMLGGLWTLLPFYILFLATPLIDYCFQDVHNPDSEEEKRLKVDPYFSFIIRLYVPVQIIFLCLAVYEATHRDITTFEWIGFALSTGLVTGGAGITLAHELMHKNSFLSQWLSRTLLMMVCYGHFFIEHVRGHHMRVATPEDPASARFGESFYHFLPRTIKGSLLSAFRLEQHRLKQLPQNKRKFSQQFTWIIGGPCFLMLFFGWMGGMNAVLFFLVQSMTAICMLELVNYIEHYGLERRRLENGQYERVSPCHSWNAPHFLSNILLFHLQRHSDHHTYGARPYQILRHTKESPQLPSGYLGMMLLALIPPLWRLVMDKRVIAYRSQREVL